ncbi:MAG: phosphohydrolase [Bacteroidales bacterium]
MSYITTFTGVHFDPVNPDPELIHLEDIAHALSLLCRANGHTRFFYSVAQHSLCCCKEASLRRLSVRIQLGCLLHDASEAYLSDMPRPIKENLSQYLIAEERLQNMIWNLYFGSPLTENEKEIIFGIDDEMLSYEFVHLMPEQISDHHKRIRSDFDLKFQDPSIVELEFYELTKSLKDSLIQE